MEQLSLPYRIALIALLVVGTLYLLVLKPKDETPPPAASVPVATQVTPAQGTTAPGVKGLGTAVDKAKGAAATQSGSDAATQAATGGAATSTTPKPGATAATTTNTPAATPAATATGTTPAATKPAPAKPAAKPAAAKPAATTAKRAEPAGDPSAALLASLGRGHTVVVLFAGATANDDSAVRRAVKGIDRRGGKVDVHVVPLSRVGRYEAITRGVTVRQAPTVLVIGKNRQARTVVGFTTTGELDQLVGDARRGF